MTEYSDETKESLRLIEDLKFFLVTAPANWQENQVIRRYYLNNDEGFVSCVFWNNLYFITGTDIVRCILYKIQHFGRTITDRKKFEEGVFSDLRNLKAGADAVLESPKLEFLEFLYKNLCLRTQKKQKVFFWFNVPHDKLMADALERDIKKEKLGQVPTSVALREPALLFNYVENKTHSLYEQLVDHLSDKYDQLDAEEVLKPEPSPEYESIQPQQDDDAFPLDYLGEWGRPNFISLDTLAHLASYINAYDSNFDSIDASFATGPVVACTDDYLIEQTQPKLASWEVFPQVQYPTVAVPYAGHAVPYAAQTMPYSAQAAQYGGSTMPYSGQAFQFQVPVASLYPNLAVMAQFPTHPSTFSGQFLNVSGFYDDDWAVEQVYEEPNSSRPSLRQQEASSSMMRKRQQLLLAHDDRRRHDLMPTPKTLIKAEPDTRA